MNRRNFILSVMGAATMAAVPDRGVALYSAVHPHLDDVPFGLAPLKQEGASIAYDQLGERYARALAQSMRQTREIVARNVLGRAFDDENETEDGYTHRTFKVRKIII
jgi:hypothetical protein